MKTNKRILTVTIMLSLTGTTLALAAKQSPSSHLPGDPIARKRVSLESLIAEMDAAQAENERARGELDRAAGEVEADILLQVREVLDGNATYQTLTAEVARLVEQQRAVNQTIQDAGTQDADRAEALKIRSYDLRKQREAAERRLHKLEQSIAVKAKPELEPRCVELEKLQARSATLKTEWSQRRVERYRRWTKLRDFSPKTVVLSQDRPQVRLQVPAPAHAEPRMARFAARNNAEQTRALAEKLGRYLDLDTPGLNDVRAQLQAENWQAALDEYEAFFIRKMRDLNQYGVPQSVFRDWMLQRHEPCAEIISDAMCGVFHVPYRGQTLTAEVGQPGAVRWCFVSDDYPGWSTENCLVEFYRSFGRPFREDTSIRLLLDAYISSGDPAHLRRWCEIMDDWCLNWRADIERYPDNLRHYDAIASRDLTVLLGKLHVAACMHKNFAEDLSSATLARVLMQSIEEYNSAVIRTKRGTIFNWTAMGLDHLFRNALILPEFRTSQWTLAEARKLAEREFTLTITPDGGVREFSDFGHQGVWAWVYANMLQMLHEARPGWFTADYEREFRDLYERNLRFRVRHLKPDGHRHNEDFRDTRFIFFDADPWQDGPHSLELQAPYLFQEPEIAARMRRVYGERDGMDTLPAAVPSAGEPAELDDAMPYLATFYQRRSWSPDDAFLYLRALRINSNGDEDVGGLKVWHDGQALAEVPPIYVDGVSQNSHYGLAEKPGGKTEFLVYDDGQPGKGLWHTSEHFSLCESIYEGAYQESTQRAHWSPFKSGGFAIPLQHRGEPAIEDVQQHSRQVFFLRPQAVWIVVDRMTSPAKHDYQQNYEIYTPVRAADWCNRKQEPIPGAGRRVVFDEHAGVIRSNNPGFPNLTIFHVASSPMAYEFRQGHGIENNPLPDKSTRELQIATDEWRLHPMGKERGRDEPWSPHRTLAFSRHVQVRFGGQGDHVLVSVIQPQRVACDQELTVLERTSGQSQVGLKFRCPDGSVCDIQTTRGDVAELRAGDVVAQANVLLAVIQDKTIRGMVVGCRQWTINGTKQEMTSEHFEFGGAEPISFRSPIRPVRFSPETAAFTDRQDIELICDTPGVEIRYTLDGTDPTPQSALYARPLALDTTTRIKAIAVVPGLTEIPWIIDGTRATLPALAVYEKQTPQSAVMPPCDDLQPGLTFEYFEGCGFELFAAAGLLQPVRRGSVEQLFDVSMRATENEFGVRYSGFVNIPKTGVYTFRAPREFWYPDIECGYDLRLFIDGQEWYPSTRRHAFGQWSLALGKGLHTFRCIFVHVRRQDGKVELWRDFPQPKVLWHGAVPALEVSGPGIQRQPLPGSWFLHPPVEPWTDPRWLARREAEQEAREDRQRRLNRQLTEGLLVNWDFADPSGFDGELKGGATITGGALLLSKPEDHAVLTKPLPLFDGRHDFSLAFRFRKEPGSAGFLLRQASRWGQDGLGLTTDGRFQYFNPDAGNTDLNSRVLIDDDKAPRWLLVTCRDGGWSLRIYFNGELTAQGGVRSAPKPNDAPLQVGSQMRGSIEEVRMYERVLGLEEVRWLVGQE